MNLLKEMNQQIGSPKDRWNLRDVLKVADELRQPIDAGNAHEAALLVLAAKLDKPRREKVKSIFEQVFEVPCLCLLWRIPSRQSKPVVNCSCPRRRRTWTSWLVSLWLQHRLLCTKACHYFCLVHLAVARVHWSAC